MENTSTILSVPKQLYEIESNQNNISGIIYDKTKQKSIASLDVELYNLDTSEIFNTQSDSKGRFKFNSFGNSKYIILISALNYKEYSHYFTLDEDKDFEISIVKVDQNEDFEIKAPKQKHLINSLKRFFTF